MNDRFVLDHCKRLNWGTHKCQDGNEIDDLKNEFFNRFVTSIKISINSDEDCLPLDKFPLNKTVIKIISFGDFNKDFMKDSNLKDLVPVNSLEGFFDNPSHKKELWRNLSH